MHVINVLFDMVIAIKGLSLFPAAYAPYCANDSDLLVNVDVLDDVLVPRVLSVRLFAAALGLLLTWSHVLRKANVSMF